MSSRSRAARRMTLGEHAFWTVVVTVALVTSGLAAWFVAQAHDEPAATASTPAPCVWDDELARTLAELDEDPADWTVTDIPGGYGGRTSLDARHAYIDRDDPCTWVSSVVKHEWMHLQQARMFGGTRAVYAAYGGSQERLELVADYGSLLLGAEHTPYVDEHEATSVGCSSADLAEARKLIKFHAGDTCPHVETTPCP